MAMILVDFPLWPGPDTADQVPFFMGASRARQLLAVVPTGAKPPVLDDLKGNESIVSPDPYRLGGPNWNDSPQAFK